MTDDVASLLDHAKRAITNGEASLQTAAEYIAKAQEQRATQRQIAEAVGKSAAWVNRLLKWRSGGYDGEAFGRSKRPRVQAAEQKKSRPATQAQSRRADAAKVEAQRVRAEAQRAKAEAAKARAEAQKTRA